MEMKKRLDALEAERKRQEAERNVNREALLKGIRERASALNEEARRFLAPFSRKMMLGYEVLYELASTEHLLEKRHSPDRSLAKPVIHMEVTHPPVEYTAVNWTGVEVTRVEVIRLEFSGESLKGGLFVPGEKSDKDAIPMGVPTMGYEFHDGVDPLVPYLAVLDQVRPARFSVGECYVFLDWDRFTNADEFGTDISYKRLPLRYRFSEKPEASIEFVDPTAERSNRTNLKVTVIHESQWSREVMVNAIAEAYFPMRKR